jgi:medium-chain acyl-[acyl-carrier-protein] hydrolase
VTGSLLHRPPRGDGVPLVCLPYAGGGSRSYQSWQHLLPPGMDPLIVQLPGREGRLAEPLPEDLVAEAGRAAAGLAPLLAGRFAVFGHSMGALLAFEFVRALRDHHSREPACLIVSGTLPPSRRDSAKLYGHLDDAGLRAEVEKMGGTDLELLDDPEAWALIGPVLRADLVMCDKYRMTPGRPLDCTIVAYGSRDDCDVPPTAIGSWGEHTTARFEQRIFPGSHFYFQAIPEAFAMDLGKRLHRLVLDRP